MADTPAFRAELALVQQQLVDLCKSHECRAMVVVVHADGDIDRVDNMGEDHVKKVCAYISGSKNAELQPQLMKPEAH